MHNTGDYLNPNLLQVHHYHKPPLTYQITALGYKIFGVNAFGARFFLQLAVVFQLLLINALTFALFENKRTSILATVIYFSFPIVLISSRNLTTDAFLATFALWSIYAWVKYRKSGKFSFLYIFTLSLALGMLTKGPVIFIIPAIFILFYNQFEKSKNNFGIHHLLAWLLFLAISFSWFIYLITQNQDFLDYFLGRQTVDRFSVNAFNRTEPFWYFLVFAPFMGLPWILTLPKLIAQNKNLFIKKSIYLALVFGMIIPLLFFSISSSKRLLYILPMYSLLAIFIAQLISMMEVEKFKFILKTLLFLVLLILALLVSTYFLTLDWKISNFLKITGIIMIPIVIVLYRTSKINDYTKTLSMSFIFSSLLILVSSSVMSSNELKVNSTKPIAEFIIKNNLKDRPILVYNSLRPSIAFGLNKSIISLNDGDKNLARETQFETSQNWKNYLINLNDTTETQYLKSLMGKPTCLIVYKKALPENRQWLIETYKNAEIIEKYTIYY
jgi:4-amino-4-deoxy-L-arabinose transferase